MRRLSNILFLSTLVGALTHPTLSLAAEKWTNMPSMLKPRAEASAVIYQDDIYVFNGFAPKIDIQPSVEKFDSSKNKWISLGKTSVSKGNAVTHNGVVRVGQDIWLIGGRIGRHPGKVTKNVWIYNIKNGSWRQGPSLPIPGAAGGAALVNNKIHWFGGLDTKAKCDVANHFTLDLNKQDAGWKNITDRAAMPSPRNHFATIALDNKIYAIGGQVGHDGCKGKNPKNTALVHVFNPNINRWARLANTPKPQSHTEPSTFVHNGFIYSVGGSGALTSVLRFDPRKNKWSSVYTLPEKLLAPIAGVIDGRLLVAGGGAPDTRTPTTRMRALRFSASTGGTTTKPTTTPTITKPTVTPTTTKPATTPTNTTVTSGSHVLLSVEAEDFTSRTSSGSHQWINSSHAGASNKDSMLTTPDKGALNFNTTGSPMLSYTVNFTRPGVHYLWIRGWGDTNAQGEGKSDSLHAGLNGVRASSADNIDQFPPQWNWTQSTRDKAVATLNVPSVGLHTVNLWMREDGLKIDRFVLSSDPTFVPQGTGPVPNSSVSAENIAPIVDAGANASVTLGAPHTLIGSASDDGLPTNTLTTLWSKKSGPGSVQFGTGENQKTSVSFSVSGTYKLTLVADDGALQATDDVTIEVNQHVVDVPDESTTDASNSNSGSSPDTTSTAGNGSTKQNYVSREAEDHDSLTATTSHRWVSSALQGASGNGAMVTTPDKGSLLHSGSGSPMMSYLMYFDQAGPYYLWIRGWGDTNTKGEGKSDSLHAGLNGTIATSADKIDYFPTGWHWSRSTRDGNNATLNIPSAGLHSVNLWMREDGLAIDKFILTRDAAFIPTGTAGSGSNDKGTTNSNTAPVVNAGANKAVELGDVLKLNGKVSDDGLPNAIISSVWKKTTGPGVVTFGDVNSPITTATFSNSGQYTLRLSTSDGALTTQDNLSVVVSNSSQAGAQINAFTAWEINQSADGSAVTPRHEAGAVAVNGKLYILGGRGNRPVQSYNPSTRRWTSHGRAPVDMHHFQPVAHNNKIYVLGALKNSDFPQELSLEHVYIFDLNTHKWQRGREIPTARRRGAAGAVVHNGKIYLVGGNKKGHSGPAVNWFDEYNPANNSWKILPNAPHARDHATIAVASGKLVVAAGRRSARNNIIGDTERETDVYDFSSGKWSSGMAIPTQRGGTMTISSGAEVVVIGGEALTSVKGYNTVEALNVLTGKWRALQPLNVGRHSGGAAVLNGKIHVVSGNTTRGGGNETSSHETLDLPSN